ncbi:MAG: hypothetical protein HYZ53_00190 [Planctomycetes bacterium]|nr:hypothetical protein [Planctomycetota bacterium]
MLDRESTFADPEVIRLLTTFFVPVALDVWYEQRRQDAIGDFYREVVFQGPRGKTDATTQGRYCCTPEGRLLGYTNNRGAEPVRLLLQRTLKDLGRPSAGSAPASAAREAADPRFERRPPAGALTLDVHGKMLVGAEETEGAWRRVNLETVSRDHMWVRREELEALAAPGATEGTLVAVPESFARRLARFHLVDEIRGEPPMWLPEELLSVRMELRIESVRPDLVSARLTGEARLGTRAGDRTGEAAIAGRLAWRPDTREFTRFDLVARGPFRGEGTYNQGAPKPGFVLGVSFRLADGRTDDRVPPQGSRDLLDYLGPSLR